MARVFIFLSKEASIEENKRMLSEVYNSRLDNLNFLFEKFPTTQLARVVDEDMNLDLFLKNIKRGYTAKLTLGRISDEPLMIEGFYDNVFIPNSNVERWVNWFCPWSNDNFNKLDRIFKKIYDRGILDFPLIR